VVFLGVSEGIIRVEEFFIVALDAAHLGFTTWMSIPEFLNIFSIHNDSDKLPNEAL